MSATREKPATSKRSRGAARVTRVRISTGEASASRAAWRSGSWAPTRQDEIYVRLRLAEPGPRFVYFSAAVDDEYFEQLTGKKLLTKYHRAFHPDASLLVVDLSHGHAASAVFKTPRASATERHDGQPPLRKGKSDGAVHSVTV
jgi:hypothetical protein